jgi:hypothetical protein
MGFSSVKSWATPQFAFSFVRQPLTFRSFAGAAQGGFLLFEMVVVLALGTLIATWASTRWTNEEHDARSQATAMWLMSLKRGVDEMLKVHVAQLRRNMLIDSQPDLSAMLSRHDRLRVEDLVDQSYLAREFPLHSPLSSYETVIQFLSVGQLPCLPLSCRVQAWVILIPVSRPGLVDAGTLSVVRLGKILQALEGQGLVVHPFSPDRLKGPLGDFANPPSAILAKLPIGSIALLSEQLVSAEPQGFGGSFVAPASGDCTHRANSYIWKNPLTQACRCPQGYVARILSEWRLAPESEYFGAGELVRGYICVPPL